MERARCAVIARTLVAVLGCAFIVACNTVVPYVPPSGPDTAKLLIRGSVPAGMKYGIYAYEDARACRGIQRVAVSTTNSGSYSSQLRAAPLTTLRYVGGDRTRICALVFSFQPKPRHTYLLKANQDNVGCLVQLIDATDVDHMHPENSFVRRVMKGNECQPVGAASKPREDGGEGYQGNSVLDGRAAPSSGDQLDDFKDLLPSK